MNVKQAQTKAYEFGQKVGHLISKPIIAVADRLPQGSKNKIADWARRKHEEQNPGGQEAESPDHSDADRERS